jgi:sugar phosphate isomerase/epimerase
MKKFKVGIQLYTVRDFAEKDFFGTLDKVAEMGYDCVEFAGYGNHTAAELKSKLESLGLEPASVHSGLQVFTGEDADKNIEYLAELGVKYVALPWLDETRRAGKENFELAVKEIIAAGKALKKHGMTLLYHNHDFEFELIDGKYALDILYDSVPAEYLQTEIDTCWARYAGQDPADYVKKYAGRAPVVHLKDFACDNIKKGEAVYGLIGPDGKQVRAPGSKSGFEFRPIGMGVQDIPAIIAAAEYAGTDYLIVEQDGSVGRTSLEAAKLSRDYLKSLGL